MILSQRNYLFVSSIQYLSSSFFVLISLTRFFFFLRIDDVNIGALARITCLAEDENGDEAAPFYTESHETNEDGYFLVTFSLSEVIGSDKLKLKECKAFLENSPLETCKVPTDVNYGITGAFLSLPRFLPEKLMTLYTVGPFIYTSDTNSVPADDHSAGPDGHY